MKIVLARVLATSLIAITLLVPTPSHAWFFFFVPLSLFTPNDKKTVEEMEAKKDWQGLLNLSEVRLQSDEKNPVWMNINAYALYKLGKCNDAIPKFEKAIELKPDYKEAYANLGVCHLEAGNYDRVIAVQTDAIGRFPEMWQPYFNIGLAYVRKQDAATARVYLEQLKTRNMVWAGTLENNHIKPLEYREEQHKLAVAAREKEEQERAERERQVKEEAEAKLKADAEAKAAEDARARVAEGQVQKRSGRSLEDQLKELKQLYSKGLLSKDVYEERQREVLRLR